MCYPAKVQILIDTFFHEKPPLYAHYSLIINSKLLLAIRIISLIYLTGFFIYDMTGTKSPMQKIIFLTNVTYFFTWLYFLVIVQSYFIAKAKDLDKFAQILFQVSFCYQIFVVVAYWGLLYSAKYEVPLYNNINWHGVPALLLIIDFIFNSFRFVPQQYAAGIIYGLLYMFCINMPYSIAVKPVYGIASDWVGWITYIFVAVGILVTFIVFMLSRIIYAKCKQQKILQNNQQTPDKVPNQSSQQANINISKVFPVQQVINSSQKKIQS